MIAKSLDVVVFLKLLFEEQSKTYAQLSQELGISASEIHAAVRRGVEAGIIDSSSRKPIRKSLQDYLLHGVRYAFPGKLGSVARGMPTAYAAPPLAEHIHSDDLPPVWPDAEGTTKGQALEPLYQSVPKAAKSDPKLYELLTLVDAIRLGRARERKLAEEEIRKRLSYADAA